VAEGPFGIRLFDAGLAGLVAAAIEVSVAVGGGPGAVPLNLAAYLAGALLAAPVLFRRRWPFRVMLGSAAMIFIYYLFARRLPARSPHHHGDRQRRRREREVVALVAAGMSNDEIGRRLAVSPLTAKTHVSRAMTKLNARDRAQLVVLAYEHGLTAP